MILTTISQISLWSTKTCWRLASSTNYRRSIRNFNSTFTVGRTTPKNQSDRSVRVFLQAENKQTRQLSVLSLEIPEPIFIHDSEPKTDTKTRCKEECTRMLNRERLNHLMSVFNDAWRYLDLCFIFVLLFYAIPLYLFESKQMKNRKRKRKRVKTRNSISADMKKDSLFVCWISVQWGFDFVKLFCCFMAVLKKIISFVENFLFIDFNWV